MFLWGKHHESIADKDHKSFSYTRNLVADHFNTSKMLDILIFEGKLESVFEGKPCYCHQNKLKS